MKYLVNDQGIFVECSSALSDKGRHDVIYTTNFEKSNPQHSEFAPGSGFDYLTKEKNFFNFIKQSDCIVNFDVFQNDEIKFLREIFPQKSIFGSGAGEVLEHNRWALKQQLVKLGLPVGKSYRIIGLDKLRKFLQEKPDKFIKTNIFRKDVESFYAKNYKTVEQRLNGLEVKFGILSDTIEFIGEDPINTECELGYDGFFNGSDYTNNCFLGIEWHKEVYVAKFIKTSELPKPMLETMNKFKPVLQNMKYRGALSTEEKILSDKEHYLIDWCSRLLSPASAGYGEWIKNFPELIFKLGKNDKVNIECPYKYVAAIFLESPQAENEYCYMDVKPENRNRVKFMSACKHNGGYYAVKDCKTVAIAIGNGNTHEEALKMAKESADMVDCDGMNKDILKSIDNGIKEVVDACKKVNINF